MREIKNVLIVSDIDGTFLGKGSRIVEKNVEAIEQFKAKGGMFTFATGRVLVNINTNIPIAQDLLNAPAILANGGYLYDYASKRVIRANHMDPNIILPVIKYIDECFPNVTTRLMTEDHFWIPRLEGLVKNDVLRMLREKDYTVAPIEEWPREGWIKFVVRGKAEDVDEVRDAVEQKFGKVAECSKSGSTFLEYQKLGCSKATAILTLKEYYRQMGRDVTLVAAGDYENDLEMLKAADVSVCPSNALDAVKEVCDYCLCDHDDGLIANIIELIENGKM